jgi:hypothetical protein
MKNKIQVSPKKSTRRAIATKLKRAVETRVRPKVKTVRGWMAAIYPKEALVETPVQQPRRVQPIEYNLSQPFTSMGVWSLQDRSENQ